MGVRILSPLQIVDELTYRSYAFNRENTPSTTPAQWSVIFGLATPALEARYQREKAGA